MTDGEKASDVEWIALERTAVIYELLVDQELITADDRISSVTTAGEGNMNCTLRVCTSGGSFVVKQSRPWVEKYPSIPAPVDRALHEIQFYQTVAPHLQVSQCMPHLLACDPKRYVLVLEDLGDSKDGSFLYNDVDGFDLTPYLLQLAEWLAALHGIHIHQEHGQRYSNQSLRTLNHAHVFQIPFQIPPAIDLDSITPGLNEIAARLSKHEKLVARAAELGKMYLEGGASLLHGDFFPGSWLFSGGEIKVIDPEFCFLGHAEFDLAVCCAHLRMAGFSNEKIDWMLTEYHRRSGHQLDDGLIQGWAGMEVIRRLLGVAQLPLDRSLEQKETLLDWAVQACLAG